MIKSKNIEEAVFKVLMCAAVGVVLFAVVSVIYSVFKRGIPSLSWEMLTSLPNIDFYINGNGGGLLNAIIGS
ncbi:MAG: phosphate ABC transporter permease, partial [Paludibacteraceae bacterium]|nr:phosphate ABC transporter permease [Paludibacteraceae bacterium]